MTATEKLRNLADIALRICRSSLERTGGAGDPVVVLGYADGTTKQMNIPQSLHCLFNDGEGKDLLYGIIRAMVERTGATCMVLAAEAWVGRSTEKASRMPADEFWRLSRKHDTAELAAMGLVERTECIVATAQDAERLISVTQSFRRLGNGRPYSFSEPEMRDVPQEQCSGPAKMFGDLREENLR